MCKLYFKKINEFYLGGGPVPLTPIPANCGLSVTQGPTAAVLTVLYRGCYVTQEVRASAWTNSLCKIIIL